MMEQYFILKIVREIINIICSASMTVYEMQMKCLAKRLKRHATQMSHRVMQMTAYATQMTGYEMQMTAYATQMTGYEMQMPGYVTQMTGHAKLDEPYCNADGRTCNTDVTLCTQSLLLM